MHISGQFGQAGRLFIIENVNSDARDSFETDKLQTTRKDPWSDDGPSPNMGYSVCANGE